MCMCVCVCACVCVRACVRARARMRACLSAWALVCFYPCPPDMYILCFFMMTDNILNKAKGRHFNEIRDRAVFLGAVTRSAAARAVYSAPG